MNRRNLLVSTPALVIAPSVLALPTQKEASRLFTASTSPDRLTQEILTKPLRQIGAGRYDVATNISLNFPQLIEQNYARMNSRRLAAALNGMDAKELNGLAQLYASANLNQGRTARLHDLMALRLDGAQLGRVSANFGYAPMYEAVNRVAQEKMQSFLQHSNASYSVGGGGAGTFQSGPNVGMTIYEIYQIYRSAPMGSLAPVAATYMTGVFAIGHLSAAASLGYGIGTSISWLMQTYTPSLHNALGAGLYYMFNPLIQSFQTSSISQIGDAQRDLSYDFGLSPLTPLFESTGGDYGVVSAWAYSSGSSGGSCWLSEDPCPAVQ